jgi:hypothetical protein
LLELVVACLLVVAAWELSFFRALKIVPDLPLLFILTNIFEECLPASTHI